MPSYKYEVIGPDGKPQTGTIDASNLEIATAELKSGGNTIVSLSKANAFNKDLDIHIGKAVSVVLLVMQVAGTGGTFPIEVAPGFFKAVYPLLPFTHSMAALREAVGGLYGMDYWIDLGKLCIFLMVSLIVGLVLRKPIIKVNEAFSEKLEETKIM